MKDLDMRSFCEVWERVEMSQGQSELPVKYEHTKATPVKVNDGAVCGLRNFIARETVGSCILLSAAKQCVQLRQPLCALACEKSENAAKLRAALFAETGERFSCCGTVPCGISAQSALRTVLNSEASCAEAYREASRGVLPKYTAELYLRLAESAERRAAKLLCLLAQMLK